MKSSQGLWKIKLVTASCACAFGMLMPLAVEASDLLLASTSIKQEAGQMTVELWGDRLPSGYLEDLLVVLKNEQGKLVTAYAPSIKGGYNPTLRAVKLKPRFADKEQKNEQLMLSVAQGDWRAASEFRVLDFSDGKKIEEIFSSADNMGLVTKAQIKDAKLEVTLKDGQNSATNLPEEFVKEKPLGRLYYGGLYALTPHDVDGDGQEELFGTQQLVMGKQNVADVGAVWRLQEDGSWKNSAFTIMTVTPTPASNTVNDGCSIVGAAGKLGEILPRRIVVPGGEATYPIFVSERVELQNDVNKLLAEECSEYLERFYKGQADMAFKVMNKDERILSIQLISGKTSFIHHHINLDPATGQKIGLEKVLNTKDKDLLPLLRLLCTNKNIVLEEKLPAEWYIEGKNLFLMQRICGKDEVAGFDLGNLHKFLLDKKWLKTDWSVSK